MTDQEAETVKASAPGSEASGSPDDGTQAPEAGLEKKELTPAAKRALAEAEARRRAAGAPSQSATEIGGQDGPDPVRFGDWEKNGIASDF